MVRALQLLLFNAVDGVGKTCQKGRSKSQLVGSRRHHVWVSPWLQVLSLLGFGASGFLGPIGSAFFYMPHFLPCGTQER